MRTKRYRVTLIPAERGQLRGLISSGSASARKLMHARILLKANTLAGERGAFDADIAAAVEASVASVQRVRRRFFEEGLAAALVSKPPTSPQPTKLDARGEAHLVAVACSPAARPGGRDRWTLQLLADRLVDLQVMEPISYETVRRTLKKRHQALADQTLPQRL